MTKPKTTEAQRAELRNMDFDLYPMTAQTLCENHLSNALDDLKAAEAQAKRLKERLYGSSDKLVEISR